VQGAPVPAGQEPVVYFNQIAGDYFRAMSIRLERGRLPTEREIWERGASPVIVINKTMARQLFGDSNPLGRRIRSGPTAAWNEIIGVVGDVRQQRLDLPPAAEYYTTFQQMPMPFQSVVVRVKRDRAVSIADVHSVMRQLDAGVALANLMPLEQWVRIHTRERQFALLILAAFGGLALTLGALGVYGAASHAVSRRKREIGIRVALGATPREIIATVLAHGLTLAATGVAVGIVLGFSVGRFVSTMLYEVSAADPLTFSAVPIALIGVAALACYVPARRATRVDPLLVLRTE
jgi:hypothetical protein